MGRFKLLLTTMVMFYHVMLAQSMTIREALRQHIDSTPSLSDIDIALGKIADAPNSASISDSDLEFLRDVFSPVPDTHPTVINNVLHGEQLKDIIQHVIDHPLEDLLGKLEEMGRELGVSASCLTGGSLGACYGNTSDGNVSDVTTTISPGADDYALCSTDLRPLYAPIVYYAIDYIQSILENVRDNIKGGVINSCRIALLYAIDVLKDMKYPWPITFEKGYELKFLDVMAKPPTAILGGQLQWVGGYEMCHKIKVTNLSDDGYNTTRSFGGKYCRVMIGDKNGSLPVSLGFGMCFPDTCTTNALEHMQANPGIIDSVLGLVGFKVKSIFCGNELNLSTDSRAQVAVGILATLVIVVALATIYDLVVRPIIINIWAPEDRYNSTTQGMRYSASNGNIQMMNVASNGRVTGMNGDVSSPNLAAIGRQTSVASQKSLLSDVATSYDDLSESPGCLDRMEAAFAGFSASASFRKMFDVRNLGIHHMPCIDGLRFLSVVYAIGGNTCLFGILYTESMTASNLVDKLLELPHMFAFQPVINYTFSADTFLVVSGTMISYHWLRRLHKNGGKLGYKQILHFYIHRYWSLMPVMMLTIMTYTCLYKYLLSGPISPPQITDAENCRSNWWVNLLMLGNIVNTNTSCLAWTWFAPLLFQLQIVTPIILIPLSYKRWAGWLSLGAMYAIFIATVSGVVKTQIYGDIGAWYSDYIQKPWCRAGPYLIGVAVGILLYDKIAHKIPKNIFTRLLSWALWVVSLGTIFLCAFVTYTKYRKENPVKWTEDQTVTWHVFIRSVWGLAIGYMIIACQTGFGGFLNSTLSHPSFTPASRLAYPVFVVHAIFIFKYAYSQFDTIYINFNNLLYIFFGHLIMVYLIGMVIAILFFYPFQGLEYAFFGAKTKLDIITAGSCEQTFRDLKTQTEQMEEIEEKELEAPRLVLRQDSQVSFM